MSKILRFHIDGFFVAASARSAFAHTTKQIFGLMQTLLGYRGHLVFENVASPTTPDLFSITTWASAETFDGAEAAIRAYYREIGVAPSSLPARFTPFALADRTAPATLSKDVSTIDLGRDPSHHLRVESFFVPKLARTEFERTMEQSLSVVEEQQGYVSHRVFERPSGPTTEEILAITTWESREAFEHASSGVRTHEHAIGFDAAAIRTRWGARREIGNYRPFLM